jgi:hypothetical protein
MQTEAQVRATLAQLRQQREGLLNEINRQLGLLDGQIAALEGVLTVDVSPDPAEA